jgi:hypothetical protein
LGEVQKERRLTALNILLFTDRAEARWILQDIEGAITNCAKFVHIHSPLLMADLFSHGLVKLGENFRTTGKLEALSIGAEIVAGINDEDILIKGFGRGMTIRSET